MSIKEAMKGYFQKRKVKAAAGFDFLFKTPFIQEAEHSFIFEGEADKEGYISWMPVEMACAHNSVEKEIGFPLHPSIIEYFYSYWFVDLDGFFNKHYISLESVLPNAEMCSFREKLEMYRKSHNGRLDHIPIGIEGNGLLVVIDNDSGAVHLEDFEVCSFEVIASSIEELISGFTLEKG